MEQAHLIIILSPHVAGAGPEEMTEMKHKVINAYRSESTTRIELVNSQHTIGMKVQPLFTMIINGMLILANMRQPYNKTNLACKETTSLIILNLGL